MSLGIDDPVTRESVSNESKFIEKLGQEVVDILEGPIRVCNLYYIEQFQLQKYIAIFLFIFSLTLESGVQVFTFTFAS